MIVQDNQPETLDLRQTVLLDERIRSVMQQYLAAVQPPDWVWDQLVSKIGQTSTTARSKHAAYHAAGEFTGLALEKKLA